MDNFANSKDLGEIGSLNINVPDLTYLREASSKHGNTNLNQWKKNSGGSMIVSKLRIAFQLCWISSLYKQVVFHEATCKQ